jgi:hypothetical protein
MTGGLLLIIVTGIISFAMIDRLKRKYPIIIDASHLKALFFYHLLLSFAYYGYVLSNPSDSLYYYQKVMMDYRGDSWGDFYGTSTTFIEFVGYPFIKYFGFSYEAVMALFSFLGFLGFIYFYIFFKENIRFQHSLFGFDLVKIIFFLPNLHFWSSSFGKGSIIFLGIALLFYGISQIRRRYVAVIIGGLIIYHVRPHIMLVMLVSGVIGLAFSHKGLSVAWRFVFLAGASVAFFFIYQDVLTLVGISEEEFLAEGLDLTHRATELSKATSGVDITAYGLPFQVLTFLYRPLFFDAPGLLGFIISFENLFYILITLKLITSMRSITFLFRGSFLVKSAFLSFITISIALAQISGNLGLAMRQKSQVMILFMFVVVAFLDEEKLTKWRAYQQRKKKILKIQEAAAVR